MVRISSTMQHNLLVKTSADSKEAMHRLQTQLSTGSKAQTISELGTNTSNYLNLNVQSKQSNQFIDNITTVQRKLDLVETSLKNVEKLTSGFDKFLLEHRNINDADYLNNNKFSEQARNYLQQIMTTLNTKDESQFLFSGTNFNEKPFTLNGYVSPNDPVNGVGFTTTPDDNYYKGSDKLPTIRVSETAEIEYGVKANNPHIEKIVRALDHFAQITDANPYQFTDPVDDGTSTSQRAAMELARQELKEGLEGIRSLRLGTALKRESLENTKANHANIVRYTEDKANELNEVDTAEVIVEMQKHQISLEASYRLTARLQSLSLMEYI